MIPAHGRRDAFLYISSAGLASLGLGVTAFYLNFLFRALGYDGVELGALVGAQALGIVLGAIPAATFAHGRSRRAVILGGGVTAAAGLAAIVLFASFLPLFAGAMLLGVGGILASSAGAALVADATDARARSSRYGQQIALGTMASFVATLLAGAVAQPVASFLGASPSDAIVLRVLVGAGGVVAALSALPILFIRSVPVRGAPLVATRRFALLGRFLPIEIAFGFGAGSFLPFTNIFFADRFGVSFAALGLLLGVIAVGGSTGALLHGRLQRRFGTVPSVVGVVLASLPFAVVAALAPNAAVALAALAVRAALMYGSSASWTALTLSSFTPGERAGVNAIAALAYSAASAAGSVLSGGVREALGTSGYTINVLTLVVAYAIAAALIVRLFRHHTPRGDVGALDAPAPHSAP